MEDEVGGWRELVLAGMNGDGQLMDFLELLGFRGREDIQVSICAYASPSSPLLHMSCPKLRTKYVNGPKVSQVSSVVFSGEQELACS